MENQPQAPAVNVVQPPRLQASQQQEQVAPQKYRVFQAIGDFVSTAGKNPGAFFGSLLISFAVAIAGISAYAFFVFTSIVGGGAAAVYSDTPAAAAPAIAGAVIGYVLLVAGIQGFTVACISFSLSPEKPSLGAVLHKAFSSLGRLILVNILLCVVIGLPFIVTTIASLASAFTAASSAFNGDGGNSAASLVIIPLLMIASLVWLVIAALRFALAPYVALFEPNVGVVKTLGRSRHLLEKGGQWFIFKGFLLLMLVFIILSIVTGESSVSRLNSSQDLSTNISTIIISLFVEGVLVMLYFNRAKVRGGGSSRPATPQPAVPSQ